MTLFYYDPTFAQHATGDHPESPQRVLFAAQHLAETGLLARVARPSWQAISPARLAHTHHPGYLAQLKQFAAAGGGYLDSDTVCSPQSYDIARQAAGAVADAVTRVVAGEDRRALCLIRPPGHHALADRAMGFCLLNNIAVGANLALAECNLDRVLIIDWDVHHGNGTQSIFWENERVGFLSIHRWPFYPGSGRADETGGGAALGTKVNLPIEFGTSRRDFLDALRSGVERLADKIRPQLVLVSAGFDAHRNDPIGSLGLETEDFGPLTQIVRSVADVHAQGRIVSVLEGGYDLRALADSVGVHLEELLGTP
ncbi:MAG TPA: histone deacetylase [Pirellulales bacterium]